MPGAGLIGSENEPEKAVPQLSWRKGMRRLVAASDFTDHT
jgi:hypothetical protein